MADISKIKLPNNIEYNIKDPISYNKIVSRGEQLIVNGSGMLGNNTNWSNWTFDGSHANSSAGSFTRSSTSYANIGSDEFFPVNSSEKYKFEFDLISENNTATMYAYLSFYDVDKISITASNTMYYSGTLTTLARELKAGDTKVYLTNASAYRTYGTGSHLRALIFWDYKNSFGYQYPPETYSRYVLMPAWTDDSSIDKTNNIITLATAYTGVTHPAGTYVSQGCSGGTYKYSGITGQKVPTEWTHYTGYFDGTDYSGTNAGATFPPATAYCKVGFLWNYNSANDHFWLTNTSVKEVPKEAIYSDNAGKVNNHTVNADVPSGAKFTDTTALESMTGTLPVNHGGTGKTTANDAADNLISGLPAWTANPTDDTYFVRQDTGGTSTFGRVKFSTLWNYIKGKFSGTSPITFNNGTIGINTASTSAYGATKLSTATNSTATDLAATPSAVKTAYDLANTANGTANTALSGVNGTLIYDHTYSISNGVATFTAHVYQKGVEVTNNYADSCFEWSYKLASAVTGTPSVVSLGTGKTKTITISTLGYGGYVLGTFTPPSA